ncbi:MAG: hypothetical protein IJR28_03855 [Ottowia sp.]|nr:hypothetical protein [Ottowia sp.]
MTMLAAALLAALGASIFFTHRDIRRRRRHIEGIVNARANFSDSALRAEFGAQAHEWPQQKRALHDIARALSLPAAKLRADDDAAFLEAQHWCINDRLLEFEWFIAHRASGKTARGSVTTLGQLVRLLAQLGY